MRTNVPEKMLQLMDTIDRRGRADPAGMGVLRKWLAEPGRLAAFAVHAAQRTAARKEKPKHTGSPSGSDPGVAPHRLWGGKSASQP